MALTDLTGTKWRFNTSIGEYMEDVNPDEQPLAEMLVYTSVKDSQAMYWADINFISNGQNFIAIGGPDSVPLEGVELTEVHDGIEWIDQAYRIIEITGGTDATNPALIAYMQFNAEQIIDSPVLPSFSDVEVTPHEGYITMTINGVDFNLEATIAYPTKGDLIRMTLGNETPAAGMQDTYRVLKIDGTIAEVVAMFDQNTLQTFGSNSTYNDSSLDTYLTNWYNTLSADAKAAIVVKTFTQDSWYSNTSGDPNYNGTYGISSTAYQLSLGSATYGAEISRNVYALSVQDIIDYLGVTSSMTTANTTLTAANVWAMFWNTTSQPSNYTYPWLRSALAGDSDFAFYVRGIYGGMNTANVGNGHPARPAFSIDLSKIEWSRVR